MSIRGFQPGRAVEVIVARDSSNDDYGSGYRIGGRLVLTTAHLLDAVGSYCDVRDKRSFGKEKAQVVWKDQDLDIALIELPEKLEEVEPIVLGKLPEGKRGEKIAFLMYGYPAWARTERNNGKFAAGGRQVEGIIYLSDTSPDGLLVLEPLRLPEGTRDKDSDWGGSSGAAIICDGLVVAVQKQHQNPERPASLEAVPLWTVCGDEEWKNLLKKHGINPEPEIACLELPSLKPLWRKLSDNFNFLKQFSSEAIFSKDCKDLLDKVENDWIKPNLDNSFYNQVPIQLSLEKRLDLVELISPEQPEELRKLLPKGTKLTSIFNDLGRAKSLLILGQPGVGKTTALLELTQSLVKESKRTSDLSVPIFLNLSSWTDTYQSLDFWLAHQLDVQYNIRNKKFIKTLIQERETIFVLDGLDEARHGFQASCIQAINKFRSDHAQVSIVVGSRLQDYEQHSLRLKFRSAVCIQALSPKEVSQYLRIKIEALESVKEKDKDNSDLKEKITQLIVIKGLLYKDADLQKMIDTPLILGVIYTVAGSQTPFKSILKYGSIEERRQRLFDVYITKVLNRRKSDQSLLENQKYKEDDMKRWLCWLSRYMNQQSNISDSQAEFRIEQLQPHCLETDIQRYRFLVFAMSCFRGLQCGILTGGSSYIFISIMSPISSDEAGVLMFGIIIVFIFVGTAFGLFTGLLLGIASAFFTKIKTVKTLTWSFDTISFRFLNFMDYTFKRVEEKSEEEFFEVRNLVFMLFFLTFFLTFKHNEIYYSYMMLGNERFIKGYEAMVASGATLSDGTALWLTLTIAIWFFLGLGISEGSKKTFPGQGILESRRVSSNVLLFMTMVFQPIYFYVLLKFVHAQPQFFAIQPGFVAVIVTITVFWCGGITKIQHFALRDILSMKNFVPHELEKFLDLSTKLLLLKRFGGSYTFFHPLLQDHFLKSSVDPTKLDVDT